jgi:hypothetical protein
MLPQLSSPFKPNFTYGRQTEICTLDLNNIKHILSTQKLNPSFSDQAVQEGHEMKPKGGKNDLNRP